MLRVHLLGAFKIERDGRPLEGEAWRGRQARAILKFLLAQRGSVVTLDQLIELLWPDEDPEAARRNLYVRISQLRHVLDPLSTTTYILTLQDGYQWNPAAECWIDCFEFETLIEKGQNHQEKGDIPAAVAAYEAARGLYRGDFLEEDRYVDWTHADRERLRERYLNLLTELAECYAQEGRFRRAVALCDQILVRDCCREAVYLRKMLYHYYAGEQDLALRTFERCRQVLAEELDIQPLAMTRELSAQIRSGRLWAYEAAPRYPPPVYEGRLFAMPYSLSHIPFVGREREYAWLMERWRHMPHGILLIQGEAGIGKSRLVEEFLGFAGSQGVTILRTRASGSLALPYAPVVEALRSYPGLWVGEELPPITMSALSTLFNELCDRWKELPELPSLSPLQERERLFLAVETLVRQNLPTGALIFIDDAHAADPASLALIGRLGSYIPVILACRLEEISIDHPLAQALYPLRQAGLVSELRLGPLSPVAIQSLIQQLAHHDLPALTRVLTDWSDGNPLFVGAWLGHLFEQGDLYVAENGHWVFTGANDRSVPTTVRQVMGARLHKLNHAQRRVFDLVAIIGGDFDFQLLQHASQLPEDALFEILDSLIEAGLLVEPRVPGRAEYAPVHRQYIELNLEATPSVRCRRLHLQVATALQATATDLDVTAPAIAHHFEQSGKSGQAFEWLLRAGDAARARFALPEALAFFQRAAALQSSGLEPVWERMGELAHHMAHYAEGAGYFEKALQGWKKQGDLAGQIRTHYALAEILRELSQYELAAAHAQSGLEIARNLQGKKNLVARGYIVLSNAMRSGQLAPTEIIQDHLRQALRLAEASQDLQGVGEATFWLGVTSINSGNPSQALAFDRQALGIFNQLNQIGWQAITQNNLAYHALLAGQPELAEQASRGGLALARQVGSFHTQGWLLSTLGEALTQLGRLQEARTVLEEGLSLVTQWGPPRLHPGLLSDLARVDIAEGNSKKALERLEEAFTLAQASAPQFIPRLHVYLAQIYLETGALSQAETHASQAQELAQLKGQHSIEGQAWRFLGLLQAAYDHPDQAQNAFTRSLSILTEIGDSVEVARTQAAMLSKS